MTDAKKSGKTMNPYRKAPYPAEDPEVAWDEGYAAGLRAAQELAKEHAPFGEHTLKDGDLAAWDDFDAAVEAEIARLQEEAKEQGR